MTLSSSKVAYWGVSLARWGVLGMAVSMPISRAVFNLSALLMIAGWLVSGQWREKFDVIRKNSVATTSIVLFAVCALSLIWASPLTAHQWDQLVEYSRLLYVALIVSLLQSNVWLERAWKALLAGMLFTLGVSLLDIWFEIPGTHSYGTHTAGQGVFYHHIAQGMMLSFLGAYCLHCAFQEKEKHLARIFWLIVSAATLSTLISVGQSRTGQLSVLIAYVLVVMAHIPKRIKIWGLMGSLAVAALLIVSSERTQERFALAAQEVSSFQQDGEHTSVGARLKAWQFSFEIFKESPWLGHGIGSYKPMAYQHFAQSPICQLGVCEQPHNQFILTAVETGVLGLLAITAFLVAPLVHRADPHSTAGALALPFVAIVVVTACFDSILKIQAQSFFTVVTLALLMAARTTSDCAVHKIPSAGQTGRSIEQAK